MNEIHGFLHRYHLIHSPACGILEPVGGTAVTVAHVLGFPRIGARRELKFALEAHWRGELSEAGLLDAGRAVRARTWAIERAAGLDFVTVGDFAWYDHVLQTIAHLGCLPERFGLSAERLTVGEHFALARGTPQQPAMELTKWFDTNYHYLVPEWSRAIRADGGVAWLFDEVREAQALGHRVKAVLLGPLTLLRLGKARDGVERLALLERLVPAYRALLARLADAGVAWVQLDEPALALDLEPRWLDAFRPVYAALAPEAPRILLATYYGPVAERCELLSSLPVAGLHLDLVRGREDLEPFLARFPDPKVLSLGVVDGRNVWRTDLDAVLARLRRAFERLGERLWIAPSCPLLHVPVDLGLETRLEPALRERLAFAVQKLEEVVALKRALAGGGANVPSAPRPARSSRPLPPFDESTLRRARPFAARNKVQRERLRLPPLPTTTIGSFPQTAEIRRVRARLRRGEIAPEAYEEAIRAEIRLAVSRQERLGLDVLVHGEAERGDMVEYFAERLEGFACTEAGWVQSYGSRCARPPIVHGDPARSGPITVGWARFAQSLTRRPVKGMLTGPVTLLQWSYPHEEEPREAIALRIAAALREEVLELERSGIAVIQIDEPAFREGLPLRERERERYLDWAVRAFRLASAGVADATQIHTHMCYAEFEDILPAIAALDADVVTIEASRSGMALVEAFARFRYPNEIGPGVYDVHSPHVPDVDAIVRRIEDAARAIPPERLWVNPDCGLKTRSWPEVEAALANMVEAARRVRERLGGAASSFSPAGGAA
jgi:5-methyltetrahydropteroyltriglutamate--homocysteine methyltransferase